MSTTSRGPYRTGIKRRREVLEAAADIFGQYGYAGGSLRQIAEQVGVTPTALLRLFGTKENLLIAVLEYWGEESAKAALSEEGGLRKSGLAFFKSMESAMEYHTTHRGLLELFLTLTIEATDPAHPARQFITRRYEALIAQATVALAEAERTGEVRPFTAAEREHEVRQLFAIMDGIEIQWLLDPTVDLVESFHYAFSLILQRWQQ